MTISFSGLRVSIDLTSSKGLLASIGGRVSSPGRRAKPVSFDANARDADSDGRVQDATQWERPAGERLVSRLIDRPPGKNRTGKRSVLGPEGVVMQMDDPVTELGAKHGEHRDWSTVRSVDPGKRADIARSYAEAAEGVSQDPVLRAAWTRLAMEVDEQYEMLKALGVKIEFVDEDPYIDFHAMVADYRETKRLKVLRTAVTGSHPFFTDEQNDKFRAVHDAFGHLATGRGFDRHGEEAAYQAHRTMFSPEAQKAAATELRAQNQFLIFTGEFGPQKMMFLPENLRKMLAAWLSVKAGPVGDDETLARQSSDNDNAYRTTGSHHVSCGRVVRPSRPR